jgi:fructosamine-3-kinase
MSDLQILLNHIAQLSGQNLQGHRLSSVAGGDINQAYHLQTAQLNWFIKLNQAHLVDMFSAEAAGLQALAASQTVRVPQLISYGACPPYAYLVLEHITLKSLNSLGARRLGQQLAALHSPSKQTEFGWIRNNTIGPTPQSNTWHTDWIHFWQQERLAPQLQLAAQNGYHGQLQSLGDQLITKFDRFFDSYQPHPALLHGDLWGGNAAADLQDQPVLFDPACYYGDRETDLAMTELFGGFGSDFYAAYNEALPLDVGYKTRKTLYNLYHILNHLNLFGSAYLRQSTDMIAKLLAEL